MKPYGNQLNLKKKVSYESKKNSEKISILNIKLIHQIFDTINISLLTLIFILLFLSTIDLLFFKELVLEDCINLAFLCKSEELKTCNLTNLPNKQNINRKLKI